MTLFIAIEASLPQFIGAVMQFLSFRRCLTSVTFRLCIIDRGSGDAARFARAATACGINTSMAVADPWNPYLNKWAALDGFHALPDTPAMVLDWDLFNNQPGELPVCDHGVGARANPPDLYGDVLALSSTARMLNRGGGVASSINGGVLVSTVGKLRECGARTKSLVEVLHAELPNIAAWKVEQFALSIAVGELELTCLPDRWNVTPVSPVNDADVGFFHYNDCIETTRRLKLRLHDRAAVESSLGELENRWPLQARRFNLLHAEALELAPVRSVMKAEFASC